MKSSGQLRTTKLVQVTDRIVLIKQAKMYKINMVYEQTKMSKVNEQVKMDKINLVDEQTKISLEDE